MYFLINPDMPDLFIVTPYSTLVAANSMLNKHPQCHILTSDQYLKAWNNVCRYDDLGFYPDTWVMTVYEKILIRDLSLECISLNEFQLKCDYTPY